MTEHAPTGPHYYDDGLWRPYDEALTKLATAEAEITRLEAELVEAKALVDAWAPMIDAITHPTSSVDAAPFEITWDESDAATPTATAREGGLE